MTTPHDKALEATNRLLDKIAEHLADSLNDSANWMDYRENAETCLEAIVEFGGIVCAREPVGAWYEDSTGCFHMSLNVQLEEEKAREYGHQIHYFHAPIPEAGNGDGWFPIERADMSVDRIYDLPGMLRPIANSEEYWCRDSDGRVFLATWADDGKRAYWWDLEGEIPVDPVEFMPHPLDPRFRSPPSIRSSETGREG